jgi:predicted nucleic acid-binding protein
LQYFQIEWPIARLAGDLKCRFARKGVTLAVADVSIAAVAIYHNLTLLTDNLKHYPMADIHLFPLPKV